MENELNEAINDVLDVFNHLQQFAEKWGGNAKKLRSRLTDGQQRRLDAVFAECEARATFLE